MGARKEGRRRREKIGECPGPASGSRRLIPEWLSTTAAIRRRRATGRSNSKGPRPRRYLSTSRATPQTKIAVETAIRQYQKTISQVERPANVERVGVNRASRVPPQRRTDRRQHRGARR